MKKILHITNWYPNQWNDLEGVFVKEQFKVFSEITDTHLINVQVREGRRLFEYHHINYSTKEEGYFLLTKIKSNKVIELLTTFLLLWVLIKSKYKQYDLLHFHIAYPLLIHYFIWKKIIKIPVIISEHWSAYHFNFYMPKNTKKLDGIKRIFKQKIPLISVSKALLEDIQKFSGTKISMSKIIPNVIDQKYFYYRDNSFENKIPIFFIVNNWRKIKNPFPMLEGFAKLFSNKVAFKLIIGGYGELLEEMKIFVRKESFERQVIFLGKMNKEQIANELSHSNAYLFSSEYETFSVVCAQALCCGVPLIGPAIPAILEYTDNESFLSLKENNSDEWEKQLSYFIKNIHNYNRKIIAKKADLYLSNKTIMKTYQDLLNEWF